MKLTELPREQRDQPDRDPPRTSACRSTPADRRDPRRIPRQPIRIAPATQDRIPGPTSGGILWLDPSSAMYVVPQKKYTTPSLLQIRAALGELGWDISAGYGWEAVR